MMTLLKSGAFTGRSARPAVFALVAVMLLTLTGCLYPKDKLMDVPPKEAVRNVQAAIDQYFAEKSLLPIVNSSQEVSKYEKYKINFQKLTSTGYLSSIPTAAFENGGNYYFIIIDEETDPRVKLMDIVTFQKINDIQNWVKLHMAEGGALPKKEAMYPGFYAVDYEAMNKKAPVIKSVYSGGTLSALVDDKGQVYTDYGLDIMQLIQKNGTAELEKDADLRALLVDSADFVPVKAPEYRLVDGEPVAIAAK
ncbi:hypothetical protein ACFQZE_02675 [Paenibacillus sp. GCM10027627]|uniref:hypothetical protein n=1 Tax=unclassified Paenibacillus TaxID=185978 RepID=UPI003634AF21